jgi:uncharacterized protein involved in oxidation of intracellular sulfur
MNVLFILNDGPYGSERSYNGLRLAGSMAKKDGVEVQVFFIGDAAACAKKGQKVPEGYYNIEVMGSGVVRRGGKLGVCGTCMDARGLAEADLFDGAHRSTLEELTAWSLEADKVLVF